MLPSIEPRIGRPLRRITMGSAVHAQQKARIHHLHQQVATLKGKGSARRRPKLEREFKAAVETLIGLNRRLRAYRVDNALNLSPVRIVLLADSAFGTPEVFQRLLELGYEFTIKSYSGSNAAYKELFNAVAGDQWVKVDKNRRAVEGVAVPAPQLLGNFPIRLVALRRWDSDGRAVRRVVVTTFGIETMTTKEVVTFYHARQTIKPGFQECKGIFHFGQPRLCKYQANAAFTQIILFAFNLIRWMRPCMHTKAAKIARLRAVSWSESQPSAGQA